MARMLTASSALLGDPLVHSYSVANAFRLIQLKRQESGVTTMESIGEY